MDNWQIGLNFGCSNFTEKMCSLINLLKILLRGR